MFLELGEHLTETERIAKSLVGPSAQQQDILAVGTESTNILQTQPTAINSFIIKQKMNIQRLQKLIDDTKHQLTEQQSSKYWGYNKETINQQWLVIHDLHDTIVIKNTNMNQYNIAEYEYLEDEVRGIMIPLYEKM